MNLTLPKLKNLWDNRKSPKTATALQASARERHQRLLHLVSQWDANEAALVELHTEVSAGDADIPKGGWQQVMAGQRNYYEQHENLKPYIAQIAEVSEVLHLANRKAQFRIASRALAESAHETALTSCERQSANPESRLASYNLPFQVIQFYFHCRQSSQPKPADEELPITRFPYKFLWMLANREQYLPIFSLRSLQNLRLALHHIKPEQAWNEVTSGWWEMSLDHFIQIWPGASDALCREITGRHYADLVRDGEHEVFQSFLFINSLEPTTTHNALDMLRTGNQALILYGPPGTGKTYHATEVAKQMQGEYKLVQFHPSYSYQDFMCGIMPGLEGGTLSYKLNEGIFLRLCKEAAAQPEKPFVLIIDEINRADLSSVFGELMYALEYRGEEVQVPHFDAFSIPKNVYLIGTMNMADKSLATFDVALRRRFTFLKLGPDLDCLLEWNLGTKGGFPEGELAELIQRAKALNLWLLDSKQGLGRSKDLAIGQAYFMKIADFCPAGDDDQGRVLSPFALEQLWDYHLEPLIEEYLGAEVEEFREPIQRQRERFTASLTHAA